MAFDEKLAERVRRQLVKQRGLVEKGMFGGLAFLLNGNLCCGVLGRELIVRIDPAQTGRTLKKPHTHVFDMTGRPMKGWIMVRPAGIATESALGKWVQTGALYAASLPPK